MLLGYRLFSEEIFNEYAAQTMFFQSQAFPTENKPEKARFFWLVLFPKKAKDVQKKPEFQNLASKKPNLASKSGNPEPQYQLLCFHYYNCLLFIIIPLVTDVHVMLKKIECERRVSRQNVAKERLSVIYTF